MINESLRITVSEIGVARLYLSRPQRHNALNAELIGELTRAVVQLGGDHSVRVVTISGDGESFCAGADLDWMKQQLSATRLERIREARALAHMLKALNELPKPLIGAIRGAAYGGGTGIVSVCDAVIATEDAKFGLTETRLGLIPATIGPYVVARIGDGNARRASMSGRTWSADEAQRMGLVHRVVASADLEDAVETETKSYLFSSPAANAAAKDLFRCLTRRIDEHVIEETITKLADTWDTVDAHEGIMAFFEKRRPAWVTR